MTENAIYNSKILLVFINLLKTKYPAVDPYEVMRYAGVKPYEVNDEAHWFTQAQVDRFIERLVQLTGNQGIAREGGRFAGSMESMNLIGKYVLGLLGPANVFYSISKATTNLPKLPPTARAASPPTRLRSPSPRLPECWRSRTSAKTVSAIWRRC